MTQTSALYRLQHLDRTGDSLRERLHEIEALLEQNETVRAAQDALRQTQEQEQQWRTTQSDLELQRGQMRQEQEEAQKRLYSGNIHNPRELTDLQDKVAELEKRISHLDDPLLEAMYGLEEALDQRAAAEAALQQVVQEQSRMLGDLSSERAELSARLSEHAAEVGSLRGEIDASALALYDRLRERSPIAVAAFADEQCGVCRSEVMATVSQQVRRGQVAACPTCGRILHQV